MSAKRKHGSPTSEGCTTPASHNYYVVVLGSEQEPEKKKAKVEETKPKYYEQNPNDPTLAPEMRRAVLKSIKSKRYRDQQASTIASMKIRIDELTSELVKKSLEVERLRAQDEEKNALIRQLMRVEDKSEINAAKSLVQLKMQGPHPSGSVKPAPKAETVSNPHRFLKECLATYKPA
ncbi:hypothetical protein Ocin01_09232 [Orchesella cincta]|uniref:Uncharacterized protein n=1 Tax=Orchesella cincta TaxID=48709 RepID=A0A1D2MWL4_ORCCI|nr:hypothetical protein Ocin01_09232 [Orchesella cincta]